MDFLPPGYIQRVGDERFPRFVIRDQCGQFWARDHWSDQPAEAVLFSRETDAMEVRNRHALGDAADTFRVAAIITVHASRWSLRELARFLKRHKQFAIKGLAGKDGVLLELLPKSLKMTED